MCGFPRSGSTLLLLMIESCVSDVRTFGEEISALAAAKYAFRNHPLMVTKDPGDVFFTDEVRDFYEKHRANTRFVLQCGSCAILTSKHKDHPNRQPGGYYAIPERWRDYFRHVCYAQQFPDVITVEYENLINDVSGVEKTLSEFIGWKVHQSFENYHKRPAANFKFWTALNGLRPPD